MSPMTLAGLAEVAEILKVHKNTALAYSKRPDFPEPEDRLSTGPVWKIAKVERWAEKMLPLQTGRPPASSAK